MAECNETLKTAMCQRPKRAFIISTKGCKKWLALIPRVNALNGLLSFLQFFQEGSIMRTSGVNALNGLLSFLPGVPMKSNYLFLKCQRPKRAFIISTKNKKKSINHCNFMCQRPKRAFIISTFESVVTDRKDDFMCQRPKRAFIISTVYNPER